MKILGAAIGSCVHVAGLLNFLEIAAKEGYSVESLGGAVPIQKVVDAIMEVDPDIVALSYRLDSKALEKLLSDFEKLLEEKRLLNKRYIFGGTVETAEVAKRFGFIEKVFDGTEEIEDVVLFLRSEKRSEKQKEVAQWPQTLYERIEYKKPYSLIRHHIGLSTLKETVEHVKILAESGLLDIISIAPDQNCQQYFFEPDKMDPKQDGAGGVPIRSKKDFEMIYEASRRGNYPLLRCYSGTRNLLEFSKMLKETINNAWAAIPLFWYSDLDRRSDRPLLDALRENQKAIKWNAENNVPVEINDAHQWALRYAHDALEVAISYIAAYNAKYLKVKDYVMQYMLSTPPKISPAMDIAKALAKLEMVKPLEDENFRIIRMIRTGLLSFPADPNAAMGQLASTMFYGAYLKPHIVHVVAYCEAIQRATSKEIIESVKMVRRALNIAREGLPDFSSDKKVKERKEKLMEEANLILEAIRKIGNGKDESFVESDILYAAVKLGILDAPGLKGFSVANGRIRTAVVDGANVVVDENGNVVSERERLKSLGIKI
ncbi:MAG: cobalamin B12-binding domain-containing protein [Thermotogae bacterium]|nr:cobalamin B12-binding domain-containing protein [Thermotogota bacterium]